MFHLYHQYSIMNHKLKQALNIPSLAYPNCRTFPMQKYFLNSKSTLSSTGPVIHNAACSVSLTATQHFSSHSDSTL